jgi:RNA polymerase sigma-70 factor, ECF subfamily
MTSLSSGSAALPMSIDVESGTFRLRLDRIQNGDVHALGELYQEHGRAVYNVALRLTRHRADAEDVTQELFLRLPAALQGFTGGAPAFAGWLRKVAVRQALMQLRGLRRRREVDVAGVVGLFARTDGTADRLTVEGALDRLSEELRTVFLLKEVEGYSHAEIGEMLGISAANSEVRLHRARRQLRDLLASSR